MHPVTDEEPTYDHDRWCKFHSTVARNIGGPFDEIWEYVTSEYAIDYEGYVERVTLIRNGNIVKEYSVPQGRFLNSEGATAKPAWDRDETLIERYRRPDDHKDLVVEAVDPVMIVTLGEDTAFRLLGSVFDVFVRDLKPGTRDCGDVYRTDPPVVISPHWSHGWLDRSPTSRRNLDIVQEAVVDVYRDRTE